MLIRVPVILILLSFSFGKFVSLNLPFISSLTIRRTRLRPLAEPFMAPAHSPLNEGPVGSTMPKHRHHQDHRHHRNHRHHHIGHPPVAPAPSEEPGCQICLEPFTSLPLDPHCSCVYPMRVRLLLHVPLYGIFPEIGELAIEVASGTYLQPSQVAIIGATADGENSERTFVEVNLIPLGEKFDNTSAKLTYDRFFKKKVPLNISLFGEYDVINISYPGLPLELSPPPGSQVIPITVDPVNKSQKMNHITITIISLSASMLLVICFVAASIFLKWRKTNRQLNSVGPFFTPSTKKKSGTRTFLSSSITSSTSSFLSPMPTAILSVKTFSCESLGKATEKFSSKRVLGEGGFGRVYHGILEGGTEVAVKLLTKNNQSGDREFIAEVEMLSRLHHRNLVKLIGICIEDHTRCLVYELVRNGSVESHLHGEDKRKGPLDWDSRLKIALGAARGLAYLHEDSNPRVIHRDFKAANVLLEDDFTPKVSDFGLAREATEGCSHHISTRVMGTFGYVAPEYAMTGHLLVKSDVYSYGVVLLELLSGRKPVDMCQPPGEENLVAWARPLLTTTEGVAQLADPSLARNYNFDDMAKVAAIASMCVHPEVTQRPFMGEVVQALKLIYSDINETCAECSTQKGSSARDSEFKYDFGPSERSWWNNDSLTPRLNHGNFSSFVTMDYSSGALEERENRPFSALSLLGGGLFLPIKHGNRSGPLKTVRSKPSFYRLKGSVSEHGFVSKRGWDDDGLGSGFDGSF